MILDLSDTQDDPDFDFAIDTALSMDGGFPDPGPGDYMVVVHGPMDDYTVLVSRRYTAAVDEPDAATIALYAACERYGLDESLCSTDTSAPWGPEDDDDGDD